MNTDFEGCESPWPDFIECSTLERQSVTAYQVRPIRSADAEPIRQWRNAQLNVLRQKTPLSVEDQRRYFRDVVRPDLLASQPSQILFGFLEQGRLIGYGGFVHISWANDRAELSFLIAPERAASKTYRTDFGAFLGLMIAMAHDELGFHRLTSETFASRVEHMTVLTSVGFELEGRFRDHTRVAGRYEDSLMHGLILER